MRIDSKRMLPNPLATMLVRAEIKPENPVVVGVKADVLNIETTQTKAS